MDPELLRIARALVTAQRNARSAGVELPPDDMDAFVRKQTGGKYGLRDVQQVLAGIDTGIGARNLGRSVAQGALFNFADELVGLLPDFIGGEDAKEEMRLREQLFRQEHPIADTVGQVAGGIGAGLLVPAAGVARGAGLLGKIGAGAALGAGAGALAGAGAAEGGVADRLPSAASGAVSGGLLGAAVPPVATGIGRLASPTERGIRRIQHAVRQSGGPKALLEKLATVRRAGRGNEIMLGDLSERLAREMDFAANASDDAAARLVEIADPRMRGQSERILGDVEELVGDAPVAEERLADLQASRRAFAASDEGFEGLRKAGAQIDPTPIKHVLEQPVVKAALRRAQETGMIGDVIDEGQLSFQKLQDIKEALDDATAAAFRAGDGNRGARLAQARDAVRDHIARELERYPEVAAEYHRRIRLEKMVEEGRNWWNRVDTRTLDRFMRSLTPEEQNEFRLAMASELLANLRSRATNRDLSREILNASPSLQDKLRVVFGTKEAFEAFLERAAVENWMSRTRRALGNSATARRLMAADFDPAEIGVSALGGPSNLATATTAALGRLARGRSRRRTAAAMFPFLSLQGADAIEEFLRAGPMQRPVLSEYLAPSLTTGAASGLLDRL